LLRPQIIWLASAGLVLYMLETSQASVMPLSRGDFLTREERDGERR
jgi:hypothetical protein